MNDIPTVEDLLTLNIVLYDIDIVDGNIVGELARRSVQKHENTVRLLRYSNNICYVDNFNAVFQSFRCSNSDTVFNKTFNFEQKLATCSERVKMSIRLTRTKPKKLCLTNRTLSEMNKLMSKQFSKT